MTKIVLMAAAFAAMLFGTSIESRAASLVANIDVSSQTMTVSQYGQVLYRWSVSTARRGYFTPPGTYRPQRTARMNSVSKPRFLSRVPTYSAQGR